MPPVRETLWSAYGISCGGAFNQMIILIRNLKTLFPGQEIGLIGIIIFEAGCTKITFRSYSFFIFVLCGVGGSGFGFGYRITLIC